MPEVTVYTAPVAPLTALQVVCCLVGLALGVSWWVWSIRRLRRTRRAWGEAARRTGLDFRPGPWRAVGVLRGEVAGRSITVRNEGGKLDFTFENGVDGGTMVEVPDAVVTAGERAALPSGLEITLDRWPAGAGPRTRWTVRDVDALCELIAFAAQLDRAPAEPDASTAPARPLAGPSGGSLPHLHGRHAMRLAPKKSPRGKLQRSIMHDGPQAALLATVAQEGLPPGTVHDARLASFYTTLSELELDRGRPKEAVAAMEAVVACMILHASGATSGGEGLGRIVAVREAERALAELKASL